MPYIVTATAIPDVLLLEPRVFADDRGSFFESFNDQDFRAATGCDLQFVQDNQSHSRMGVVRGLHYQLTRPQGKLVRVTTGEAFDVAVDLRRSSPTFGRWVGEVLSAANRKQLWIPPGFAHGFMALSDGVEFLYKTTDYWVGSDERAVLWSDRDLAIDWPQIAAPVISAKDLAAAPFAGADVYE